MSSIVKRPNGHRWICYKFNGKRHTLRLGVVDDAIAKEVKRRLDSIIGFREMGLRPDPEGQWWLSQINRRLHASLLQAGLTEARGPETLGHLLTEHEAYLVGRGVKPSTLVNSRVLYANMLAHFGDARRLDAITVAAADAFRAMLLAVGGRYGGPLSPATVSNRCRRARGIFAYALQRSWVKENPFRYIVSGSETNDARNRYVLPSLFAKVADMTTDHEFRLLLALVRFCGLRCPSEVRPLPWSAIDWHNSTIVIHSPKTGRRECPIFDTAAPYVYAAREAAPEREPLMFPRHQTTGAAITGKLATLCKKAGELLWEKPFVNMRASAERDMLAAGHEFQKVVDWLGHSMTIANKHYSRVAKERDAQRASSALRVVAEGVNPKPDPKLHSDAFRSDTNDFPVETP